MANAKSEFPSHRQRSATHISGFCQNRVPISAAGGRMGYICPNISPIQSMAASLDAVPDRLPKKYSDLRK